VPEDCTIRAERIGSSCVDVQDVQVWDSSSGRTLLTYRGHSDIVNSVAWSPDGKTLASASDDTVQVWDASSGHTLLTYRGHTNLVNKCGLVT